MRRSIQSTLFPKVLSDRDVTGNLPDYCAFPVSYATAKEIHIEEGRLLIQRYSNYLFYIEWYEMDITKELRTAYAVNESTFFLFLMFDGNLSASTADGAGVARISKGIMYGNYKSQGSSFVNSVAPGMHRFCYLTPRGDWLQRKAADFPAIGKFYEKCLNDVRAYGYMAKASIDARTYKAFLNLCLLQKIKGVDMEALLLNRVIRMLKLYDDQLTSGSFIRADAQKERVRMIRQFIDDNYRELKIGDVQMLSEKFFFARRSLTRVFKNETGFTVQGYIEKTKLENALKLLKETKLSIGEISAIVGYPDQNYFSRVVKKHFGTSPKNVREQFWKAAKLDFSTAWP